jgi:hypothetical protein
VCVCVRAREQRGEGAKEEVCMILRERERERERGGCVSGALSPHSLHSKVMDESEENGKNVEERRRKMF